MNAISRGELEMPRLRHVLTLGLAWTACCAALAAAEPTPQVPLALHPDNPHYFLFRGRPTVLITSGEHYGAVLNRDFDYARYLDELQAHGLNQTRLFSGAYVEPQGAFSIANNTLAPAARAVSRALGSQRNARLCQWWEQVRSDPLGRCLLRPAARFRRPGQPAGRRRGNELVLPVLRRDPVAAEPAKMPRITSTPWAW